MESWDISRKCKGRDVQLVCYPGVHVWPRADGTNGAEQTAECAAL